MARLVRTLRVRRGTPCRKRRGSDLVSIGRLRRAWSVRSTCGAARHVSKLERYLQVVLVAGREVRLEGSVSS